LTFAFALTLVFAALSIFGAYAWYRAMYGLTSSHDYLIKVLIRLAGRASMTNIKAQHSDHAGEEHGIPPQ
jgi:hypothetical protein